MSEQVTPTAPGQEREETYAFPLSFSQQRLWFLDRLEPGGSAYNVPLFLRLRGSLDAEAFQRALDLLVARHEMLRTTFVEQGGEPVQLVSGTARVALSLLDVGAAAEDPEREVVDLALEEANRPFDLTAGPMLRARLLRLADDDHVLALTVHHIAADGWSTAILFRDLFEFYGALVEGREPRLPELEVQYADFAVWQRDWLLGERLEEQLDFWRGCLAAAPTVLELPSDRPRPPAQSLKGGHVRTLLPRELQHGLEELSRREGVTLFMTLLAGFAAVLSRYSGHEDVLIGTPIANRTRVELEEVVGFFANTLVLRTDLAGNPTFRELLARTREATIGAYAHQDLPFEKLVEELNPERALSHSPLFQVLFAFQNMERTRLELPGLDVSGFDVDRETAKWDLALFVSESADGLRTSLEYATDLFDADRMERLLGHLRMLLEAAVAAPEQQVGQLPLLTSPERATLDRWNDTQAPCKWEGRQVHELVEAQAARTPDAAAVVLGGLTMTYAELDRRANRLARRLRVLGVTADVPVGVCMRRSQEAAVALLAVLKAGGAYVPLDPTYPSERLAFMLEEAAPPVVLAHSELAGGLSTHGAQVLLIDDEGSLGVDSEERLEPVGGAESLAYVLYTSGSTGRPKGVAMPHGPLVNLLSWQLRSWTPPKAARTLQFASLSFDVAFQEIFSTWCAGGTLVLVDEETRRDVEALIHLLREQRVERLFLPFVALDQLAEASLHLGVLPESLREVMTAGEALVSTPAIREFFRRLDGCVLHNHYGPTESHVVTAFTLEGPSSGWPARPPIGRPITNARVHLLDGHGQRVPVGVPGELHIAGPVLARGYLNRPDLTGERFVPDPFAGESGARMYRTGDLARYRPDGEIEYLGRTDSQVKIRGYRVELGEVEAALLAYDGVREAAAVIREQSGGERLVAYIVPEREAAPAPGELREFLRRTLPEFMVPQAFVSLAGLPLSPTGKVDRRALPAPDGSDLEVGVYVGPRNDTERELARIWQRMLGSERPIGVTDDFFALGGHSLLAVRLFSEIERVFGVKLPLALLFQGGTIEDLAGALEARRGDSEPWSALVPLRPQGTRPPLFVLGGIDGEVLFYRELVSHLDADQPVYALQPRGLDGRSRPHVTMEGIAADYVEEIIAFQPDGPYLLCGHCFSGVLAYEVARQLHEGGRETSLLALIDATPFGHRPRGTRVELERVKFADFRRRDLRGKAAWVTRRAKGAVLKVNTKARWLLFDGFVRCGLPLPRWLRDVRAGGERAMATYVTPPSPCKVTLFRAAADEQSSYYRPSFWSRLAEGGAEIHPVVAEGIRHDNIMDEPYAGILAADLERCIERALAAAGQRSSREVA